MRLLDRPFLAFLASLACFALDGAMAAGPIRIDPENPRYFEWKGLATVLVASGEHFGSVINADFDFTRYLATIRAAGLNHTRLFLGDYVEGPGDFGIIDNPLVPAAGRFLAPWARSDQPGFARGGPKFDLNRRAPAYFDRLHAFFRQAEADGIVVEAVLFFVGPNWNNAPLHPRNNINIDGTTPITAKQYLSLVNGNVLKYQEADRRKLVRESNRYDHLVWNLCNEPWFDNQEAPGFVSQPHRAVKAVLAGSPSGSSTRSCACRSVTSWAWTSRTRAPSSHRKTSPGISPPCPSSMSTTTPTPRPCP